MNAWQYVVINEYGAALLDTVGNSVDESLAKFRARMNVGTDKTLDSFGCCIGQLGPTMLGPIDLYGHWGKRIAAHLTEESKTR